MQAGAQHASVPVHTASFPCLCSTRRAKMDGPYDSRYLPILLTVVMMLAMGVVFAGAVIRLADPTAS